MQKLIHLISKINQFENVLIEGKYEKPMKIRLSTIEIIRRYVILSTEYIKAAALNDKTLMEECLIRLNKIADKITPDMIKELPPKAISDLQTNNKNLKEITKRFLQNQ